MDSSDELCSNVSQYKQFDDEEDQVMYEKAVRIHSSSKIPKIHNSTLQNSCFDVFLCHADRFVSLYEQHQFNFFDQIPSRLKLKFLDFILSKKFLQLGQITVAKDANQTEAGTLDRDSNTDDSKLRGAFLKMLLAKQPLKILELEKIIIKIPHSQKSPLVLQIVAQVVADSPDLEEFKCNLDYSSGDGVLRVIFGSTLLDQALKFDKLRVLELRGTADRINDSGLQAISSHLPQLTTLKISLDKSVSRLGLSSCLSAMAKLRFFSFIVIRSIYRHGCHHRSGACSVDDCQHMLDCKKTRKIFEWCAEDVAQLQEISAYDSWKSRYGCKNQMPSGDFFLFAEPSTCRVNRQVSQLQTVHATGWLPSAQFPDLQILKFRGPISNRDDFLARCLLFTKLTSLELFLVSREETVLVLQSCGRGLTRLALRTSNWSRVDDCLIMALCPNLVFFSNCGRHKPDPASNGSPPAMMTPVKHLAEVELDFLYGPAPAYSLQLMLASPVIRSVGIDHLVISALDLVALSEVGGPTLKSLYLCRLFVSKEGCSVNDLERMVMNVVGNSENLENFCLKVEPNDINSYDYFKNWDTKVSKLFKSFKIHIR